MKTILFYFSATGNTLSTARLLAGALDGETELISISGLLNADPFPVHADRVGFVSPVYYGDIPYLFRTVIPAMKFEGNPYIFAVFTPRDHLGAAALRLNEVLNGIGQKISMFDRIAMPGNSWMGTPEEDAEALRLQAERVSAAAEMIIRGEENFVSGPLPEPSPIAKGFYNMRGLEAVESCIGCGICTRVCPMSNISIIEKHAVIGENCVTCLACFHWCPKEAIWMSKGEKVARRPKYHHPDIKLTDIIKR